MPLESDGFVSNGGGAMWATMRYVKTWGAADIVVHHESRVQCRCCGVSATRLRDSAQAMGFVLRCRVDSACRAARDGNAPHLVGLCAYCWHCIGTFWAGCVTALDESVWAMHVLSDDYHDAVYRGYRR